MYKRVLLGLVLLTAAALSAKAQSGYGGVVVEPRWQAGEPLVAVVRNNSKLPVRITSATLAIPMDADRPDCVVVVPLNLTLEPAGTIEVLPEARQAIADCLRQVTRGVRRGPQPTLAVRESAAPGTAQSDELQPVRVKFALEVTGRPVEVSDAWRVSP